jgi:hypothetical protein
VIPSLPGYGFSSRPDLAGGVTYRYVAGLWHQLQEAERRTPGHARSYNNGPAPDARADQADTDREPGLALNYRA